MMAPYAKGGALEQTVRACQHLPQCHSNHTDRHIKEISHWPRRDAVVLYTTYIISLFNLSCSCFIYHDLLSYRTCLWVIQPIWWHVVHTSLLINLAMCKLRKPMTGSAIVSARMVTYRSCNDHDNFERFITGNSFHCFIDHWWRLLYMCFISIVQTPSNKFSEDVMTDLRY